MADATQGDVRRVAFYPPSRGVFMFSVTVTAKKSHWLVETTERHEQTFVGWYRTLAGAEERRQVEEARLRKKYPDEPLDLRS